MSNPSFIGYEKALRLTLDAIHPLPPVSIPLVESTDFVSAVDIHALVDSPSADTSMRDGYAVRVADLIGPPSDGAARLRVTGSVAAGGACELRLQAGCAVRVLTGARIPEGATAVVADEFAVRDEEWIEVDRPVEVGKNVLAQGSDVAVGRVVVPAGCRINPGRVGILAAAGHGEVAVVPRPRVALVATGDEVVQPGRALPDGKLFASNVMTLNGWCRRYRMQTSLAFVKDRAEALAATLTEAVLDNDAVITSGGAWTGDRDLMARVLRELGWEKIYHRVRMGPGKAVGLGFLHDKPIFILPGGPPSNLLAFLELALPGLLKLAGDPNPSLPRVPVVLARAVTGKSDWTQFIWGKLIRQPPFATSFLAIKGSSRLGNMAEADAVIAIPEGQDHLPEGARVEAQLIE